MLFVMPALRLLVLTSAVALFAQSPPASIVGASTNGPGLLVVAPGQIVRLHLQNLATRFDSTQAVLNLPLPRQFGPLSVQIAQSGTTPVAMPVIRGNGWSPCSFSVVLPDFPERMVPCNPNDTGGYDLRVQIPFELKALPFSFTSFTSANQDQLVDTVMTVVENGQTKGQSRVFVVEDQIEILTECRYGSILPGYDCTPQLYHADNQRVTMSNPARAGEELILYAYGLGQPDNPVPSGAATPSAGARISRPFRLLFTGAAVGSSAPRYVGLTGGELGLYQINFSVPAMPADTPACTADNPFNVTMYVRGTSSQGQAAFCAVP